MNQLNRSKIHIEIEAAIEYPKKEKSRTWWILHWILPHLLFVELGFEFRAYTLSHNTSLFCKVGFCFWDRVSWTVCSDWLWTLILLISISWVSKITSVIHWCLPVFYQDFNEELIPTLLKFFHEIEMEGTPCNSSYEASITLISKLDKDTSK
jgi:hypothetical protein